MPDVTLEPLLEQAFFPFGDVIEMAGRYDFQFNAGNCDRWHDLARLEALPAGPDDTARLNVALTRARPYALPLTFTLMERHPLGSQAFVPLSRRPFVVIVAPDEHGRPGPPRAFLTAPGQGVNYLRNVWHGILTPLEAESDFLIIDRHGGGTNLEEAHLPISYTVRADGIGRAFANSGAVGR